MIIKPPNKFAGPVEHREIQGSAFISKESSKYGFKLISIKLIPQY